jgi:hypothetical protein
MTLRAAGALVAASIAVNVAIVAAVGIQEGFDTRVFRSGAAHMLAGEPLQGKEPSYRGYAAVLAICSTLGIGEPGAIAFQFGAAALATLALFALGRSLGGVTAGVLAAAFFVVDVDVARWHVYLLTDSLYMSLVVLATWSVHRAARGSWPARAGAAAIVACAAVLRPNGWLLVPIALIYWIVRTSAQPSLKIAAWAAVLIGFTGALVFGGTSRGAFQSERPDESLRQGVLISNFDGWRLTMPADAAPSEPSLGGVLSYILRHPWATTKLAAARVGIELAHARPFYSRAHNVVVLGMLALIYPLVALGFSRHADQPLVWLMAAIAVSDFLVVAATFADWDGRFLLHTFPLMVVLASAGAVARDRGAYTGGSPA